MKFIRLLVRLLVLVSAEEWVTARSCGNEEVLALSLEQLTTIDLLHCFGHFPCAQRSKVCSKGQKSGSLI